MPDDPVSTASQREQELAALDLIEHPTVKAAYRTVAETWLGRANASDAMRERFDDSFAEVMFSAAMWSSNQDKLRPKVSCITRLAHPVEGRRIPGSRWGIDNPDTVYRVILISGDERYEIRGRVGEHRMTENYFTLWDANMGTVNVLNGRTMEVDSDGGYTITVDADPANGRGNHVQTSRKLTSSTSAMCCWTGAATTPITLRCNDLAAPRQLRRARSTNRPRRPRR